jgi:hypothetical protein
VLLTAAAHVDPSVIAIDVIDGRDIGTVNEAGKASCEATTPRIS